MRTAVNLILAFAVLALIAANFLFRIDPARLNYEFLPQMAHGERYNTFSGNPSFANGATLQAPPTGAIARGQMPLHYAATPQDSARAGNELLSPVDFASQQVRERGALVFANYCAVCHGGSGAGNGTVTQRGVPPPPPLMAPHAVQLKDGQIFHLLTFGQNNMPSYASQLSRDDRWSAVSHVRLLQANAPPTATSQAAGAPTHNSAGAQP
jgi:mono/diheme cytochrome c family protein